MDNQILESLRNEHENYILPFLWMRGEDESLIRREIDRINACGIRALCLESRPHPDFCGPLWWRDVDIVLDEAKKRGMHVWILDDAHFPTGLANGLLRKKYPGRAKQYLAVRCFDVTGPRAHVTLDIDAAMRKSETFADVMRPGPKEEPLLDAQVMMSAVMMRMAEGDTVAAPGEGASPAEIFKDLTDEVRDGRVTLDVPPGVWRVFVTYTTYRDGGAADYINLLDEDSVKVLIEAVYEPHYERYAAEFGKAIAGFFSDEPGFGNTFGFAMDESIGRKMMPLPWNRDVPGMLEERLGENWRAELPLLFFPSADGGRTARARYAFMDAATRLAAANFSGQLGRWCEAHGVRYIGHIIEDNNVHGRLGCGEGHYFRAMSGQAIFGFGVRDMKWVIDFLISRGVNHLVPHAFSMGEYPDFDCPPHFYAGGHNPEFPYFARLMKYCNRLCHVFSGGKWIPEVGILYHGEMEWMDDCMMDQVPAKKLYEGHIDYAIVPSDALSDAAGRGDGRYPAGVGDGRLVINGVPLKLLIVPRGNYADPQLVRFMAAFPEVRVLFVDALPEAIGEDGTTDEGVPE